MLRVILTAETGNRLGKKLSKWCELGAAARKEIPREEQRTPPQSQGKKRNRQEAGEGRKQRAETSGVLSKGSRLST